MKIMHIAGSPRKKGSSNRLAQRFLTQAETKGTEVHSYHLNQMSYRGCQGCYMCKTKVEKCVLKDELAEVLDRLYETDLLLISTPVYFGDVSGQLKCFIDRLFSLAKPDYLTNPNPSRLPKGKKLVFFQTQGAGEEQFKDVCEKYLGLFQVSGFEDTAIIRACGVNEPEDMDGHPSIMDEVDAAVKRFVSNN